MKENDKTNTWGTRAKSEITINSLHINFLVEKKCTAKRQSQRVSLLAKSKPSKIIFLANTYMILEGMVFQHCNSSIWKPRVAVL